jgi:starvation-inducible DNA-binding protein
VNSNSSQPWPHQRGREAQQFGAVRQLSIAMSYDAQMYSCQQLNHILADSQILYALDKKNRWLMRGATFHQLHLLLDKHACEPRSPAYPRLPDGAEEVPAMLSRLLEAHETTLTHADDAAARVADNRDDGSNHHDPGQPDAHEHDCDQEDDDECALRGRCLTSSSAASSLAI